MPRTAALQESMSLQRAFHRAETYRHSFLFQEVMDDLAAASMFLPTAKDLRNDVVRKFSRMVMRSTTVCRNIVLTRLHTLSNPTHDRRRLVSQMAGNSTHTPSQADELHGLSSNAGEVWIGCVRHIRHFDMGCCQAIEPLRLSSSFNKVKRGYIMQHHFSCLERSSRATSFPSHSCIIGELTLSL